MNFLTSLRLNPIAVGVWLFFAACFLLHPDSPLRTGVLFDTDDYMRLNETVNWMKSAHPFGADWFDYSQPRLSPGENPVIHWSRFVDLPLAIIAYPLIPFCDMQEAVLTAAFIVPPLLLIVLLWLLPIAARPLLSKKAANFTPLFLLFAPADLMNFMPGRVDHHGFEVIIALIVVAGLARCLFCKRGWISGIEVAFALSLGLWIGTEMLPWAGIFVALLAILSSWRGGIALRNAYVFAASFPLAIGATLLLAVTPEHYRDLSISWFSSADLIFAVSSSATLFSSLLFRTFSKRPYLSVLLTGVSGGICLLAFLFFVPDVRTGAYADYDDFFNETLVNNIGEARPLIDALIPNKFILGTYLKAFYLLLETVLLPFAAVLFALWSMTVQRQRRQLWLIQLAFLLPALLLSIFWQSRISWFTEAFAIAPMTAFLIALWRRQETSQKNAALSDERVKLPLSFLKRLPPFLVLIPPFWPTLISIFSYTSLILIQPLLPVDHGTPFSFRASVAPMFLFILLCALLRMLFRIAVARSGATLGLLLVFLMPNLLSAFQLGVPDDHAYEILLASFELLCLIVLMNKTTAWQYAFSAALAASTGLSISGEGLPWVLCVVGYLTVAALWGKPQVAQKSAIFGLVFCLASAILLVLRNFSAAEFHSASLGAAEFDFLLSAVVSTMFCLLWLLEENRVAKGTRLILFFGLLTGLLMGAFFAGLNPLTLSLARMEDFNPSLQSISLHPPTYLWTALEAYRQQTGSVLLMIAYALRFLALPITALVILLFHLNKSGRRRRNLWLIYAFFLSTSLGLTFFYQPLMVWFAQAFALPPILSLFQLNRRPRNEARTARILGFNPYLATMVLVLPIILLPLVTGQAEGFAKSLLFAAETENVACPLTGIEHYLNATYSGHPRLVLSSSNEGPELLFRTDDKVLSAPYNVKGNADAFYFLNARDEEKALNVIHRRKVDLILVCRSFSPMYADLASPQQRLNASVTIGQDNSLHMVSDKDHPTMIERLAGGTPPQWLKRINIAGESRYLLFAVKED